MSSSTPYIPERIRNLLLYYLNDLIQTVSDSGTLDSYDLERLSDLTEILSWLNRHTIGTDHLNSTVEKDVPSKVTLTLPTSSALIIMDTLESTNGSLASGSAEVDTEKPTLRQALDHFAGSLKASILQKGTCK